MRRKRAEERDLKTQIRYGARDIEVHTKMKGTGEGFKKTNLVEFMGENQIPTFDHTVKWKKRADKGEIRIPNYKIREERETNDIREKLTRKPIERKNQDAGPASQQTEETSKPAIMRQRSESNDLVNKRPKIDERTTSMDTELPADDEQMENEEL